MAAISEHVVREFCTLCDWAHQAFQAHRALYDDNPAAERVNAGPFGYSYARLSDITLEYALLQVAKLHDPTVVSGKITLSLDYVLRYGAWSPAVQPQLEALVGQLNLFAAKLRAVRNQALAHNDLDAILSGGVLGQFEENEDVAYFERLREFANIVSKEVRGKEFHYLPLVGENFSLLAKALEQSVGA